MHALHQGLYEGTMHCTNINVMLDSKHRYMSQEILLRVELLEVLQSA